MPSRHRRAFLLVVTLLALIPLAGGASPISDRLDAMVKEMTDAFNAKRPQRAGDSLAVFTFDADEQLSKRRVGFAVSELLLQRFVNARSFVVVERTALERVLKEQALGLTGAVDPDTAVKVGRVIGAHNLVLGRVDKLGGKYQVNARMVETESGEVVAASYREMDAALFESEAQPYLALVPDRQAIGIFLTGGYGLLGIGNKTPQTVAGTLGPIAYAATDRIETPHAGGLTFALGARYAPLPGLMIEMLFRPFEQLVTFDESVLASGNTTCVNCSNDHQGAALVGYGTALGVSWIKPLSPTKRFLAGVAVALQHASMSDPSVPDDKYTTVPLQTPGGGYRGELNYHPLSTVHGPVADAAFTLVRPALRLGLEWKPQQRLGLGVVGSWFPIGTTVTYSRYYESRASNFGDPGTATDVPIVSVTLPVLVVETTVSLYF